MSCIIAKIHRQSADSRLQRQPRFNGGHTPPSGVSALTHTGLTRASASQQWQRSVRLNSTANRTTCCWQTPSD